MSNEPVTSWSSDADVFAEGVCRSAFGTETLRRQSGLAGREEADTSATPGEADRHPNPDDDPDFAEEIRRRLGAQESETVIEEAPAG